MGKFIEENVELELNTSAIAKLLVGIVKIKLQLFKTTINVNSCSLQFLHQLSS